MRAPVIAPVIALVIAPVIALGIAAILATLAACSPYDPSLPHKPFLCSDRAPSCPDGFMCITDGDRRVCSDEPAPDAGVADALPAQIRTLAL